MEAKSCIASLHVITLAGAWLTYKSNREREREDNRIEFASTLGKRTLEYFQRHIHTHYQCFPYILYFVSEYRQHNVQLICHDSQNIKSFSMTIFKMFL